MDSQRKQAENRFDFGRAYDGRTFDKLIAHFGARGLKVGRKLVAPFRAFRGASDGCRIQISGDEITVFYFDTGTAVGRDGLNTLRATGWVEDGTYVVSGGFVLVSDPDHRYWARILSAFREF